MAISRRILIAALSLSLFSNVLWIYSRQKKETAQPKQLKPVVAAPHFRSDLRKSPEKLGGVDIRKRNEARSNLPRDGYVWCEPSVLTNFLRLRSDGECSVSAELKGLLNLSTKQAEALERGLKQAVENLIKSEKSSAHLINLDRESYVVIPPMPTDIALDIAKNITPALDDNATVLLESILRASPWFQDATKARVLALEQDAEGVFFFTWQGAQYRVDNQSKTSNQLAWADFTDRFRHLVDFESVIQH
jgi:hypothetical protein